MSKFLLLFFLVFSLSISPTFGQSANPSIPLQTIGIDFDNWKNNTPANWNKINSYGTGSTIDNLINQQQVITGYAMEMTGGFNGSGVSGLSTGNDSGPVPDAVMGTFWYKHNGQGAFKLTLDKTKRYRFRFYGGRDGNNDDKSADYTIGGTTVTLYNWNNIQNEAVIDNVIPNESNEVTISVKASQGYTYAILNGIVIEEYAAENLPPLLTGVNDQSMAAGGQLSMALSATDTDGDSLAFSVSSNADFISLGNFTDSTSTLLASPGEGDAGTYNIQVSVTDGKGGEDSKTFVLTVEEQDPSSPLLQTIGIDFDNWKNNTPANWNKINSYNTGNTLDNLINQQQVITGYAMEVADGFNGSGPSGLSTGDDSGPVPDAVMSTFWFNQHNQAVLKFTLDKTKRYRFRFYGGRDGNNDDKSADYTIGETTVTLYNWNNLQNEAIIDNVSPDENNEVNVIVKASQGYTYAILNGIIIDEYATDNSPPVIAEVPDQTMTSGGELSIPLSATDADGDSLAFSASGSLGFISLSEFSDSAAVLIVAPTQAHVGTHQVAVEVSDGNGGEDSATFVVSVAPFEGDVPDSLEYQALVELYEGTKGSTSWMSKDNWLEGETSVDFANWYGVLVENGDVTGLFLSGNYLDGYIGNGIGNLKKLKTLDLSFNELDPYLPNSLTELHSLEIINLAGVNRTYISQNEINVFDRLTLIPSLKEIYIYWSSLYCRLTPQIQNLANLEVLVAFACNLNGQLPKEISSLVNLRHLDLDENGTLYGQLPSSMGNLTKLKQLRMRYTNVSGEIPASIGFLSNLYELDLSVSDFSGRIPESIGSLDNIEVMDLSNNRFNQGIPSSIGNSESLRILDLSNNQIEGSLPSSFGNLSNLRSLNLSNNFISGSIPPSFENLSNLESLNLSHNEFSGEILKYFLNSDHLKYISINNNNFEEGIPQGLSDLYHFNIASNNFSGAIPQNMFAPIIYPKNIEGNKFIISNNKINSIPDLSYIENLRYVDFHVDISNNPISFEDVERNFTGPNQHIFFSFNYTPLFPPPPETITVAKTASLTLASDDNALHNHYQWQKSIDDIWTDITGATAIEYTIPSVTKETSYRCKITNDWVTDLTLYSQTFIVEVEEALVPQPPANLVHNRPNDQTGPD